MKPKVIELSGLDRIVDPLFAFKYSARAGDVLTNAIPRHKEVIARNIPKSGQGLFRFYWFGRSGAKLVQQVRDSAQRPRGPWYESGHRPSIGLKSKTLQKWQMTNLVPRKDETVQNHTFLGSRIDSSLEVCLGN